MAVNQFPGQRRGGQRLFIAVAVFFALVALAGFARTYYLKGLFDSPPVPSLLVHLHGVLMAAWIALFAAQVWLVSSKKIRFHQRLGYAGIVLAALLVIVGFFTAVAAARNGSAATPAGFPPLAFLAVPLFDLVVFAILFAGAIYYRKRPANHRRLMLLTVLNFLPPAIARIPVSFITAAGPLAFFGIPDLLAVIFLVGDTWMNKSLNKVFLAGTLLLIASHPLRIILGNTGTWMNFAAWLTSVF